MDIKISTLLLIEALFLVQGAVEYFGSSEQFVCHCADWCMSTGACSNCEAGWMGPACQYINLASGEEVHLHLKTGASSRNITSITDDQDWTCSITRYGRKHTVELIMKERKWTNWVQIVIRSDFTKYIQQVRAVVRTSPPTPCSPYLSNTGGPVYDFFCDRPLYSSQVDFHFDLNAYTLIAVCEIRINGGMNVAVKKEARQTSDLTYLGVVYEASLAVDGNTDRRLLASKSCSHTGACFEPNSPLLAWEVDLNLDFNVHMVKIYNRQDYEKRLKGFTLSTLTNMGVVTQLYRNTSQGNPGTIITIVNDELLSARGVTITIPRCQELSLCEVEVFSTTSSCPPTNFGFDCTGICNCKNASENCEKIFGFCTSGCLPGYQGAGCKNVCPEGYFGDGCSTRCINCIDASCDALTGSCKIGCSAGWTRGNSSICDTPCEAGTFGQDCYFTCNCRDAKETCNTTTGSCLSRCPAGYQQPDCQNACEDENYGLNCSQTCSENCRRSSLTRQCQIETGMCHSGCKYGWRTPTCKETCEDENYGLNCSQTCSENCRRSSLTRQCQIETGMCHSGCKYGWRTPTCKEKCAKGKYGYLCRYECSDTCENRECHHVNGSCFRCVPGRQGSRCDINCEAGTFGQNCMYNCSEGCKGAKCYSEDGVCKDGCTAGWKRDNCSTPCDEGFYGEGCASVCSENCDGKRCDSVEGKCLSCNAGFMGDLCSDECPTGLYGSNCKRSCSDGCDGGLCNSTDGSCTCGPGWTGQRCDEGCVSGYYGYGCVQVCSSTCADQLCDGIKGECQHCQSGWTGTMCTEQCPTGLYGSNCKRSCSDGCDGGLCNSTDGSCTCGPGWTGQRCNEAARLSSGVIAGIAVACILVLILAVIIAVLIFRRKPESKTNDSVHFDNSTVAGSRKVVISKQEEVTIKKEFSKSSLIPKVDQGDASDMYYNITSTSLSSTVVSITDFPQFVRKMREDKKKLYTEFLKLPRDMTHESKIAQSAENISKNSYTNICAYDHSRVILKVEPDKPEEGDYINACYIDTPLKKKAFIATQGPNGVIIKDFVRMLWQLNVCCIVMLTNLFEEGKQKCHQYWPDEGETLELDDIRVSLKEIKSQANYTVRQLILTKNANESRHVTQFHYTVWPEKSVPASGASVIDFRQKVISTGASAKSPIVVHCSDGVGRTGTFIALQYLKEEAEMSFTQDIYTCVWKLRQQRVNMVQTKDQYVFLQETSLLSLTATSGTYTTGQFVQQYPQLDQLKIEEEFKVVDEFPVRVDEGECSVALEEGAKNQSSKVLAGISTRPMPMPNQEYEETLGTYLNVVFLLEGANANSFNNAKHYIQTQTPLPSTVVDIWRLVLDHDVHVIVMLDHYSDNEGDVAVYWPEMKTPLKVGPFDLECLSVSQSENISVRNLQLKKDHQTQNILHLTAKFWPDDGLPSVSSLLQLVRMSTDTTEKGPVIVHCRSDLILAGVQSTINVGSKQRGLEWGFFVFQTISQSMHGMEWIAVDCSVLYPL